MLTVMNDIMLIVFRKASDKYGESDSENAIIINQTDFP